MTARKALSQRAVIEVLIRQGAVIPCFRCRVALKLEDVATVEREHKHPIALDGPDTVDNMAYSHGGGGMSCHSVQTNGTKATSAGGDKHKIAKAKRLEKARLAVVVPGYDLVEAEGAPRLRRKQSFPKGRGIPSRPFPKKAKKP